MPKKFVEARREITLSLPESLVGRLDMLCLDPLRGKPVHGARSALVAALITRYLDTYRQEVLHVADTTAAPKPAGPSIILASAGSPPPSNPSDGVVSSPSGDEPTTTENDPDGKLDR